MKNFVLTLALIGSFASSAFSFEKVQWQCRKGDNLHALEVVENVGGGYGTGLVIRINDKQICDTLSFGRGCPFQAPAGGKEWWSWYQRVQQAGLNPLYFYVAVNGKYEDGAAFLSDGAGMKAIGLYTGSQPDLNWRSNWYFGPGECVKLY